MKHMTKYKILIYEIIVIITNIDPKLPSKHSKEQLQAFRRSQTSANAADLAKLILKLKTIGDDPLVSRVSGHPQFLALWCPPIGGHPQNFQPRDR